MFFLFVMVNFYFKNIFKNFFRSFFKKKIVILQKKYLLVFMSNFININCHWGASRNRLKFKRLMVCHCGLWPATAMTKWII